MEPQNQSPIDLRSFLRKSPYIKENLKKFAPQHQIPQELSQNKLPITQGQKTISFNNQKNIFGQKNLTHFLSESGICYVCGLAQNAFNKCKYCGKIVCSNCLVTCENCKRLVCRIDSKELDYNYTSVCYDCC